MRHRERERRTSRSSRGSSSGRRSAAVYTATPHARPIKSPKKRGVHRTTFSRDQEKAILANNHRRDSLALHLLLKVGIRKGELQGVQSAISTTRRSA